jgi:hypothetical protein
MSELLRRARVAACGCCCGVMMHLACAALRKSPVFLFHEPLAAAITQRRGQPKHRRCRRRYSTTSAGRAWCCDPDFTPLVFTASLRCGSLPIDSRHAPSCLSSISRRE